MERFGPLRSPRGRVDVQVHPQALRLHPRASALDAVDGAEILLVLGALAIAVVGVLLPAPLTYVCLAVAAAMILLVALSYVAAYLAAAVMLGYALVLLVTKDGRRRVRRTISGLARVRQTGVWEVPRGDILWVSPVERRLRPRIRLGLPHGELVLSAWAWRGGQLEGLARQISA